MLVCNWLSIRSPSSNPKGLISKPLYSQTQGGAVGLRVVVLYLYQITLLSIFFTLFKKLKNLSLSKCVGQNFESAVLRCLRKSAKKIYAAIFQQYKLV